MTHPPAQSPDLREQIAELLSETEGFGDAQRAEIIADAIRPSAGGDWRPIDSAPRDGSAILAYNAFAGIYSTCFTTRWDPSPEGYETSDYEGFPCGFMASGNPRAYPFGKWDCQPTHWRPMPDAPEEAS